MRVLVAGATSVPGIPLLRELQSRGHEVIGLTRSSTKTREIAAAGAKPVLADVFDAGRIAAVVGEVAPEVVVSLLTHPAEVEETPSGPRTLNPRVRCGTAEHPDLVAAAQRAGVRDGGGWMIFAYGSSPTGAAVIERRDRPPSAGPPPKDEAEMLAALRGMERTMLTSDEGRDAEEVCCACASFTNQTCRTPSCSPGWRSREALPAMTGNGIVSSGGISTTLRRATADALDRGRGGQIYQTSSRGDRSIQ